MKNEGLTLNSSMAKIVQSVIAQLQVIGLQAVTIGRSLTDQFVFLKSQSPTDLFEDMLNKTA